MRFIDYNVFIYAILKPKRKLSREEEERKRRAKRIYDRVNRGEEVVTSIIHLSEISNILEDVAGSSYSVKFARALLSKKNIKFLSVSYEDYLLATAIAEDRKVSLNDALAYVLMKKSGLKEIYSFDKHFDNLDVKRLEE
ncbi:VapC toxin family PIN domain ribonuclease [Candidatus Geothermarchaeota archaeon]|nr:MAG: VapC toxin family PIN domain ribonuclease [Candidatus Geothermarchaeota archaeon]